MIEARSVASSNESNTPKALYASSAAPMDEPPEVEGTRAGKGLGQADVVFIITRKSILTVTAQPIGAFP